MIEMLSSMHVESNGEGKGRWKIERERERGQ
jgi:hypothetical protein